MNKGICVLLTMTILSGAILLSNTTSAESSTSNASVTVPEACTMTGSGMNSHTATITPGTFSASSGSDYENGIGKTTFTVVCNDYNGFAIYAIGYTGDSYDDTNHTKLVGNNTNIAIDTAVYSSGDTTSSWSMKVNKVTDSTISYLPANMSIQNSFDSWHTVPDTYTKVAQYKASTGSSTTDTTLGAKIDTTYAAFIAPNQPGDTYVGQVKYVMIHPYNGGEPVYDNQIGVVYDGNGLFFDQAGTKSTNRVVYEERCEDEFGYIGDTPAILKTRNLSNDGTQNGPYSQSGGNWYDGNGLDPGYVQFEEADKLKIVVRYGLSQYVDYIDFSVNGYSFNVGEITDSSINRSGTATFVAKGYSFDVYSQLGSLQTNPGYDYGLFIQVYPIYDEPTEGATYGIVQNACTFQPTIGTYATTNPWNGHWFREEGNNVHEYEYESVDEYDDDTYGVLKYINDNSESLRGTTITLKAYNPYRINYNGNGATAGTMNGFTTDFMGDSFDTHANLMAPNFKKTGYGFAGWSTNSNATVNSIDKIYGPNENVDNTTFTFDPITRETTLYAVWVPSSGNMQGFSCSTLTDGQVTALTDTRDNNVYTIGKMQDGNCWMMENLRLDAAYSSDSTKAQGFGGAFTGLADSEDTNFSNTTVANSKYNTSNAGNYSSSYPRYNNNNTNIGGTNASGVTLTLSPGIYNAIGNSLWVETGNHNQWYSYGNYYTWAAAKASTSSATETSICPTGWTLPYGNDSGDGNTSGGFYYLGKRIDGIGSRGWRSYPNNFIFSGYYIGSTSHQLGELGEYWSRTSISNNAYTLSIGAYYYDNDWAVYGDHRSKYIGNSIRCISP